MTAFTLVSKLGAALATFHQVPARWSRWTATLAVLLAGPSARSQTSFCDTEFQDDDWTHVVLVDTSGNSTFTAGQAVTGGNPGAFQEGTHTFVNSTVRYAHLLDGAVYDPSTQGELASISFTWDFRTIDGSGPCGPNPSDPVTGTAVLVQQGNSYFTASPLHAAAESQGWTSASKLNVAACSLNLILSSGGIDVTVHPDFGPTGAPIQLGYLTASSSGTTCFRRWGADNYCATVHLTPPTYCTAKVNSCGTLPSMTSTGSSSASATSGFAISSSSARGNRIGVLLYTNAGRSIVPFQGGFLCIAPTIRRAVPTMSGGTSGQCNGSFSIDMNCFASGNCGGNPQPFLSVPTTQINCQWWGRDTVANGSYLSNGLEYEVCP